MAQHLEVLLPQSQIPTDYFANKKVAIDFIDFARRTASYTTYELMMKKDTRPLQLFFRELIQGLLEHNAQVYLVFPGEPLTIESHTMLPDIVHRKNCYWTSKDMFKAGNKRDSELKLAEAFSISKDEIREVIAILSSFFKGKQFYCVVSPHDELNQINYMVKSGIIDVVLSNNTMFSFVEQDWIENFRTAHDFSYEGELISLHDEKQLYDEYGGFENFVKTSLLSGNDYFPGFNLPYKECFEKLKEHNFDLVRTAIEMNVEFKEHKNKMQNDEIFKGLFEYYCHMEYGIVYNFSRKTFEPMNTPTTEEQQVLDNYYEKKTLGFIVEKSSVAVPYACGFNKLTKGAVLEDYDNYKQIMSLAWESRHFSKKSVLEILDANISESVATVKELTFDLTKITYQGSYLESKDAKQEEIFRYVRGCGVKVEIEDPTFEVVEDEANDSEVVIKF